MNSNKIIGLPDSPSADNDATSKKYVDNSITTVTNAAAAAQSTANTAVTNAATAQTKANTAVTNAATAQSTADNLVLATTSGTATIAARWLYPADGVGAGIVVGYVWRLYVSPTNGYVGIGSSFQTPRYPLHVSGSKQDSAATRYYARNLNAFFNSGLGEWRVAIFCDESLGVGGDIVFNSDKRIKKNVKDMDGNTALSQIRQIRPKIYNYIDYNTKGSADVYGFIAQDIKDVILHSTTCTKDYIPNFYCRGNICAIDASNHIYEISSENDLSFEKVIDDSGNEVIHHKVKIYGYDNTEYICSVIQVNNPKNIRVKLEKEYKFADDEENKYKLFIYGQQIYDFYSLEKNAVWTVATAALQEVDRQQQADKVRIAELEATVAAQQSLINDILERLKTLERREYEKVL